MRALDFQDESHRALYSEVTDLSRILWNGFVVFVGALQAGALYFSITQAHVFAGLLELAFLITAIAIYFLFNVAPDGGE